MTSKRAQSARVVLVLLWRAACSDVGETARLSMYSYSVRSARTASEAFNLSASKVLWPRAAALNRIVLETHKSNEKLERLVLETCLLSCLSSVPSAGS